MESTDVNHKVNDKKSSVDNGNKNSFHGQNECKNDDVGMIEREKGIGKKRSREEEMANVSVKVNAVK